MRTSALLSMLKKPKKKDKSDTQPSPEVRGETAPKPAQSSTRPPVGPTSRPRPAIHSPPSTRMQSTSTAVHPDNPEIFSQPITPQPMDVPTGGSPRRRAFESPIPSPAWTQVAGDPHDENLFHFDSDEELDEAREYYRTLSSPTAMESSHMSPHEHRAEDTGRQYPPLPDKSGNRTSLHTPQPASRAHGTSALSPSSQAPTVADHTTPLREMLIRWDLSQYVDPLIDEGYDHFESVLRMNEDEFEEMVGAVNMRRGHRLRLKQALDEERGQVLDFSRGSAHHHPHVLDVSRGSSHHSQMLDTSRGSNHETSSHKMSSTLPQFQAVDLVKWSQQRDSSKDGYESSRSSMNDEGHTPPSQPLPAFLASPNHHYHHHTNHHPPHPHKHGHSRQSRHHPSFPAAPRVQYDSSQAQIQSGEQLTPPRAHSEGLVSDLEDLDDVEVEGVMSEGGGVFGLSHLHPHTRHDGSRLTMKSDEKDTDRVKKGKWKKGETIGKGAFGMVYRGMNLETGESIAIKELKFDPERMSQLRAMQREVKVMRSLTHPNIVMYLGVEEMTSPPLTSEHCLVIFSEWVAGGSVQAMIERYGAFEEGMIRRYACGALSGLRYLHEQSPPVIHRDIKPGNVLITPQGEAKLSDFGAAQFLETSLEQTAESIGNLLAIAGTPYFMAPECVSQKHAGRRSDVWSFGGFVLNMVTGRPPWKVLAPRSPWDLFKHIQTSTRSPLDLERSRISCSSALLAFLELCFQRDLLKRPFTAQLIQHEWISTPQQDTSFSSQVTVSTSHTQEYPGRFPHASPHSSRAHRDHSRAEELGCDSSSPSCSPSSPQTSTTSPLLQAVNQPWKWESWKSGRMSNHSDSPSSSRSRNSPFKAANLDTGSESSKAVAYSTNTGQVSRPHAPIILAAQSPTSTPSQISSTRSTPLASPTTPHTPTTPVGFPRDQSLLHYHHTLPNPRANPFARRRRSKPMMSVTVEEGDGAEERCRSHSDPLSTSNPHSLPHPPIPAPFTPQADQVSTREGSGAPTRNPSSGRVFERLTNEDSLSCSLSTSLDDPLDSSTDKFVSGGSDVCQSTLRCSTQDSSVETKPEES